MNLCKASIRGFTLIELLTVLTLLAVVTTIGVTMFFRISDLWRITAIRTNLGHTAQNALEIINNDVNQMLSTARSGVALTSQEQNFAYTSAESDFFKVQLENDSLEFPISFPNYLNNQKERIRVRYMVQRSGIFHRLVRAVLPLHGDLEEGKVPPVSVVAEGVLGFRIEFWDGSQWHAEWPPENQASDMPRQIRVGLTMQDINRPYEQISRQAVFPIRVK